MGNKKPAQWRASGNIGASSIDGGDSKLLGY